MHLWVDELLRASGLTRSSTADSCPARPSIQPPHVRARMLPLCVLIFTGVSASCWVHNTFVFAQCFLFFVHEGGRSRPAVGLPLWPHGVCIDMRVESPLGQPIAMGAGEAPGFRLNETFGSGQQLF